MSAQRLAKNRTDNPFDLIAEREEQEHQREATEIAAMQKEEEEIRRAIAAKEDEYEHHLRNQAREELEEFRRTTLQNVLNQSEHQAAQESAHLDRLFAQRKSQLIEDLTARILDSFA